MKNPQDLKWLRRAKIVSESSKDPSTQVGAIIVDEDRIQISEGYNGFPMRIRDCPELYNNREEKYKRILHAEQNALMFASQRRKLDGCTLYVYPLPPCNRCTLEIIQRGITRVVTLKLPEDSRWTESCNLSLELFKEAGVEVIFIEKEIFSC